jgi:hypothetical protein
MHNYQTECKICPCSTAGTSATSPVLPGSDCLTGLPGIRASDKVTSTCWHWTAPQACCRLPETFLLTCTAGHAGITGCHAQLHLLIRAGQKIVLHRRRHHVKTHIQGLPDLKQVFHFLEGLHALRGQTNCIS